MPLFQAGEAAAALLDENRPTEPDELARALSEVGLKKLAFERIKELTYPLTRTEIMKSISNSHLRNEAEDIFPAIYYAGLGGMEKGLRKFEVDKLNESATNYLFQWITVYANKELLTLEAPMGVPPSRFQKYKKIAAVRKKLTVLLGHDATDEEVYDFFQTGGADLRTLNGPIKKAKVNASNRKITLEMIQEQREVEKNLTFAQIYTDEDNSYRSDGLMAVEDADPFAETLMGAFLGSKDFSTFSKAIIKSELQRELTEAESDALGAASVTAQRSMLNLWKKYLADPDGDFRKFLEANISSGFSDFDIGAAIRAMESNRKTTRRAVSYAKLFGEGN